MYELDRENLVNCDISETALETYWENATEGEVFSEFLKKGSTSLRSNVMQGLHKVTFGWEKLPALYNAICTESNNIQ